MNQNKTRKVTWTTEKCLDAAMKYSTKEAIVRNSSR